MANILGANLLHRSVTVCAVCAEKRLRTDGLALDEVKEAMGYDTRGWFARMWNDYPRRYEHSKQDSYYVWFNEDDEIFMFSSLRTGYRLDMSAFTEDDNDKLIYITHDSSDHNLPLASTTYTEGAYILAEQDHYMERWDYSQMVRVLAHTGLTTMQDIEVLTDNDNFYGRLVTCDDCGGEISEEMIINCTECDTEIAHGKVAYALEYGDSHIEYNGTPNNMRLCLSCFVTAKEKIEKLILAKLRERYQSTGIDTYAEYAFKLCLDFDFDTMYTVEKTRTERTLTTAEQIQARDHFVKFCEDAFFEVLTEELSKNTVMCHDAIEILEDRYKNE